MHYYFNEDLSIVVKSQSVQFVNCLQFVGGDKEFFNMNNSFKQDAADLKQNKRRGNKSRLHLI